MGEERFFENKNSLFSNTGCHNVGQLLDNSKRLILCENTANRVIDTLMTTTADRKAYIHHIITLSICAGAVNRKLEMLSGTEECKTK